MLTVNSVCTSRNQQTFVAMTDSMKFGPEWLRNLSSEGNTSTLSGGGTRYHLAEHRYGREEMLALFEQSLKLRPPHSMSSFKTLYVEQALNPLALAPMTEDENRLWSTRTVPPGAPRGRGGSMDRGRGRGRGGTFHPGFSRSNSAYDEPPTRPFERNQSDRAWSERNGDLGDWGPSTSPRKDYANSRGGAIANDNWRRHRPSSEDAETAGADGWRANTTTATTTSAAPPTGGPLNHNNNTNHRPSSLQDLKWGARNISGNWRDGDSRDDQLSDRQATNRISWHSSTDATPRPQAQRKMFDPLEDHLPEWATENPSEAGGTFDASGAFHGSDADDDFAEKKYKNNLQKSASQQNIINKKPNALSTSQSATNLIKKQPDEIPHKQKETKADEVLKETIKDAEQPNKQQKHKEEDTTQKETKTKKMIDAADEFDHMKEVTDDIVAKLILDDEIQPAKQQIDQKATQPTPNPTAQVPAYPPNLTNVLAAAQTVPPPPGSGGALLNDKWYYRDPQGEVQGPFTAQEMSDWFRAGYFTVSLLVRRHIDERYFTLGDLVKQCPGSIPFLTCRLPPLKAELSTFVKPELNDPVQQIHMQRLLQRHAETIRTLSQTEPWNALSNLQQRELVTQHMMQQPQVLSDLPFIPPVSNNQMSNPLMHMISQMQQANKLPIGEKGAGNQHLDPLQQLVQQMGGLQQNLQQNIQQNLQQNIQQNMQQNIQQNLQQNIQQNLQQNMQQNMQQHPVAAAVVPPHVDPTKKEDPIQSLLRQLANQPQRDYWNMRPSQSSPQQQQQQPQQQQPQPQWLNQQIGAAAGIPTHSMWDLHPGQVQPQQQQQQQPQIPVSQQIPMPPSSIANSLHNSLMPQNIEVKETAAAADELKKKAAELEKEQKQKERKEQAEREKRKKEQEHLDKLKQQKELEEKRKEEQKKMEALKKAEMEKAKKEEEKIRKELEKVKREAEEKRLRELEEKRKLKEQRKAEEESRKKQDEERKQQQDDETKRKEQEKQREEQSRRQAEALRKMQEQQQQQRTKVAPWCQSSAPGGPNQAPTATSLSLAEIQRAEREKRATEAALQLQQQKALAATVAKETQEQQALADKNTTMHLKWATKKPLAPKKVKSLAEIQAEEQERVAKQLAEQRLAQQQKEKELAPIAHAASTSIWSSASQSLTWNTQTPQSGFWDEAETTPPPQTQMQTTPVTVTQTNKPVKQNNKPTAQTTLLNNQINNNKTQQPVQPKTAKTRAKKEEENIRKLFDKNAANNDEFTAWCMKTLATLNSDVDIPTFVGFLFDIESPYEIKDYVRQYLGDSAQALHFANQFIERRSKMKNLERTANQHKDDLCMPAPAINPSVEFQEVKGKGKKTKKSKMTKVDNRILGFSVTAAENRINVGDRDYGDNV